LGDHVLKNDFTTIFAVPPGNRKNDIEEPGHTESLADHFQKIPAYGAQRLLHYREKENSYSGKDAQSATSS
jgi:hypothetical protein